MQEYLLLQFSSLKEGGGTTMLEVLMYDSIWDMFTSGYTNVMGSFFYVIVLAVMTTGVYMKSKSFVSAGLFLLVMSAIFSPLISSSRLGNIVFLLMVAFALTTSLYGLYERWREAP